MVLLSLVYWIKTRTKRLNSLLGSKGYYGKAGGSMGPASQWSNMAMKQQDKSDEALPSHAPFAERWQDYILTPKDDCKRWTTVCCGVATGVCGIREFLRHVGESSDTGGV